MWLQESASTKLLVWAFVHTELDILCFAPPSLLQQSFNDKRKKNLFSRKFPFYKNKDQSEQETSDIDRKYVALNERKAHVEGPARLQQGVTMETVS